VWVYFYLLVLDRHRFAFLIHVFFILFIHFCPEDYDLVRSYASIIRALEIPNEQKISYQRISC